MLGEEPVFDVFLSHNRAEKAWTRQLCDALRGRGLRVFFDEDSIAFGEDIVAKVGFGLEHSRFVILILSDRSVASRWVELEWASALYSDLLTHEYRLIPILLRECEIPFVLRRLKHVNSLDGDVHRCAEALVQLVTTSTTTSDVKERTAVDVVVGRPLTIGSRQYIRRRADAIVEQAIAQRGAVVLYGPRMFGKTSLLLHWQADAFRMRGTAVVWIDFQLFGRFDHDRALNLIGREIARQLHKEWTVTDWPERELLQLVADLPDVGDWPRLLLAFDEVDIAQDLALGPTLLQLVRNVGDMARGKVASIFAMVCPPWLWQRQDAFISPWWAGFRGVRLEPLRAEDVVKFWTEKFGDATAAEAQELAHITGGHPWAVMSAAFAVQTGDTLAAVLQAGTRAESPLFPLLASSAQVAKQLIGEEALRRVLAGSPPTLAERRALWLSGLIVDPDGEVTEFSSPMVRDALLGELGKQ